MADEACIGSFREGSGVYKIDMSDATKIYNFNKPSKYMKKEIKKEIVKLKSQGKITHHLEQLQSKSEYAAYKILPEQREFLERYGYKAWKHLEDSISTDTYVIFRPEKYAIKEVEKAVVKKAGQRALKSFPAKKLGEVLDLVGAT